MTMVTRNRDECVVMHMFWMMFGTVQVTEDGCEVLTARLPSSPKVFDWLTP